MISKKSTEDYVSFETAKLLKENGFKFDSCSTYYTLHGEVCEIGKSQEIGIAPRPTLQMAMKWLRENYNLCIIIDVSFDDDRDRKPGFFFAIWQLIPPYDYLLDNLDNVYDTYESASEEAIKYCLINLIK